MSRWWESGMPDPNSRVAAPSLPLIAYPEEQAAFKVAFEATWQNAIKEALRSSKPRSDNAEYVVEQLKEHLSRWITHTTKIKFDVEENFTRADVRLLVTIVWPGCYGWSEGLKCGADYHISAHALHALKNDAARFVASPPIIPMAPIPLVEEPKSPNEEFAERMRLKRERDAGR